MPSKVGPLFCGIEHHVQSVTPGVGFQGRYRRGCDASRHDVEKARVKQRRMHVMQAAKPRKVSKHQGFE